MFGHAEQQSLDRGNYDDRSLEDFSKGEERKQPNREKTSTNGEAKRCYEDSTSISARQLHLRWPL